MDIKAMLFGDSFLYFMFFAFVAIVLLIEGLYAFWNTNRSPEARKIERRLKALATGTIDATEASLIKQRLLSEAPAMQRLFVSVPRLKQIDRLLEQSGLQLTVARLASLMLIAGFIAYVFAMVMRLAALPAVALAVAAAALPFLYVRRRRAQRMYAIDRQLPDALDLISRALRAGHAFPTGLQMVGDEMTGPIAREFRITHEEVNFGVSLQQALQDLAVRVPSTDLRYFVVAVLIQRESGGNLTEVLGKLSTLIRERFRLLEKVRVLAAEGKLSAWILCILPFALAAVINVVNPGFLSVLWTDAMGINMLKGGLVMMVLGTFWMRKIIRIHV